MAGSTKIDEEERLEQEFAKRWGDAQWTRLVSPGAVLVARANALGRWASGAGLLAAALGVFTIYDALGGFASAPEIAGLRVKPGIEREWLKGASLPKDMAPFAAPGALTSEADYAAFVASVESGAAKLEPGASKPSAGSIPCAPISVLSESWLNPATGLADVPRCKKSSDGKTIWVASFVQGADRYTRPVIGVFHEEGGRRVYRNFDAHISGTHKVAGRESVSFETIPNQVNADWPGTMSRSEDVTAPTGLWGQFKEKLNK